VELKGGHKKEEIMAIDAPDAVAAGPSFAARVGNDQVPFLLIAQKRWREIRRHIEEDAPLVVAEDFLKRSEEARELYPIG
jgi:hypothetical protein